MPLLLLPLMMMMSCSNDSYMDMVIKQGGIYFIMGLILGQRRRRD